MTTVEKLLVQIFERKNTIIEQVKQRTELYNQHLASKLLVDGITPPSWLWNPTQFSDPKELNKEELISELLLPHPRPTACFSTDHFSLYKNPITENHGKISDGLFMEEGFKAQNVPMVATLSNENRAQCAPNELCELDVTRTSPVDETDERISNVYNAPDQSLARFQRSKSRQKALEYRSSAKAQAKSRLSHENGSDVPSSSIRLSISATKQNDHIREPPKVAEPCNISRQSCGDWNLDQANCHTKENGINIYTDRTTRSRSSHEVRTFVSDSTADAEAGNSSDDAVARKTRSRSIHVSVQDDHVNEFLKLAEPFASSCKSCGETELDERESQNKENHIDSNSGACARSSFFGRHQSYANDFLKTNFSSDDTLRNDGTVVDPMVKLHTDHLNGSVVAISSSDVPIGRCRARESTLEDGQKNKENDANHSCSSITRVSRSGQQNPGTDGDKDFPPHSAKADCGMLAPSVGSSMEHLNISNEILGYVKPSVGFVSRASMSEIRSGVKGITEPANSYNSSRGDIDYECDNASSGQIVLPCGETYDIVTLKGNAEILVGNDSVSRDLVGEQSLNSSPIDAKRRRELECLTARAPSDCFMVVKPKQLDFDDMEEHNLNETSTSISRKIKLVNSPENTCHSLSESELSLDKDFSCNINQLSTHKKTLEMSNVSSKGKEDWKGSFESDVNEQFEIQTEKDRLVVSEHTMLTRFENNLGATVQIENSLMLQKAGVFLSNAVPDIEIHQVELQMGQGHESSLDMHIEDGAYNYESKDKGASGYYSSKIQNVRPSFSSNSTNQESGEPKDCLIEKDGTAYSTCIIVDEGKQLPLRETQISPCLDDEVSSDHMHNMSFDRRDLDRSPPQGEIDETADSTCIVLDERRQLPLRETQIFSCPDGDVSSKHEHNLSSDKRDLDRSPLQGENGILTCNSVGSLHHGDEILNISSASDPQIKKNHSPPERRFRPAEEHSWPQIKRRKIEDKQTNSFTTSPSFRVQKPYFIQLDPTTSRLNNTETKGDDVLVDAFKEDGSLMEVIESTPESPNVKGTFCFEEENKNREYSFPISHKQLGASLVLSSTEDDARDTRGCLAKEMRTPFLGSNFLDVTKPRDEQTSQHLLPLYSNFDLPNSANFACFEKTLPEGKSHWGEDRLFSQCSVPTPNDKDLNFDQIMPVLEGFIVDSQEDNGEVKIAGDGIEFEKLNLSRTTIERASVLAQICKSASTDTPLSHLSSCFKFQGAQDLFQSVPNGLLEQLGNSHLNINVVEQLGFADNSVNESKGLPYSDCLPYSGARFGWHSGNQYVSPVGKLWERLSSHSGNSEKRLSSNPELTCFPIEEDFSVSEENKTLDEEADEVQEEIDSSDSSHYAQREPLKDLTNSRLNPPALVSADEMSLNRDSVDFFNTKTSFTGTRNKVKQNSESFLKNNSGAKENQMLSIGANKIRKDKDSFKRSVNKPNLPRRTSARQEQKLSLKESTRNNIVSNVSSFIPLIQQKQAAAVCAGKRDIKVKALEAAEAAKRLEEKRDNERKVRKEALKLERAKMEKENTRQKELDKKKREEERKRKDADMLAKKRLREEEDRKQKEKKRMRIEVRQRQHREQEEKICVEKAEKEKQRFKHDQVNSNKDSNNDSRRQQNREKAGDDVASKKTEAKPVPTGLAMDSVQQTTIHFEESGASCEIKKAMDVVNSCKSDDLFAQNCLEKSYEISPYQCSDDEDEEEDDLPSRKLIPSWASKSSVALVLPLQQEMDPDVIFPQGSFCSMDEVLLPRKLQQN